MINSLELEFEMRGQHTRGGEDVDARDPQGHGSDGVVELVKGIARLLLFEAWKL